MDLQFKVKHQELYGTQRRVVVEGSNDYLRVCVDFSDDWQGTVIDCIGCGSGGKSVVFPRDPERENVWLVPSEIIRAPAFGFSLVGIRDAMRITTNIGYVCVLEGGYVSGAMPEDEDFTKYEQLMAELARIRDDAYKTIADAIEEALKDVQITIAEGIIDDTRISEVSTYSSKKMNECFFGKDYAATPEEVREMLDKVFVKE